MTTAQDVRDALNAGAHQLFLAPGVFDFGTTPLVLPHRPLEISGAGMGLTELRFSGGAVDGIISDNRPITSAPVVLRDMTITTMANQGGDGIRLTYAPVGASHDPTSVFERIRIRPAPGLEAATAFRRGIVLDGGWNPQITSVWIQGNYNDYTRDALLNARMVTGIELGTSMEAKIRGAQIVCCATGVHVAGPAQGKGEGLGISESAFVHSLVSIKLDGGVYGGWATPWASITSSHLFYLDQGILAITRADVVINGNSICGSHLIPSWGIGIYLAGGCKNVRVTDNHLWTTKPGQGHGIVVDGSADGVISGNVVDASMAIGAWLTSSTQGWDVRVNRNRANQPVVDQGVGNLIG